MAQLKDTKIDITFYPSTEISVEDFLAKLKQENLFKDYVYILHDKDKEKNGNDKKSHFHILTRFNKLVDFSGLSKRLNHPLNLFEKIKSWKGYTLYLTHKTEDAKNKYQYEFSELKFSSSELKKEVEEIYLTYKPKRNIKKEQDFYLQEIGLGNIREYEFQKVLPFELLMNSMFQKKIRFALNYFHENYLSTRGLTMDCIWITGEAGSGKTSLAKLSAEMTNRVYNKFGASKYPIEAYKDEPCFIWDDLRIYTEQEYKDLLGLIDPNNRSFVSARYHNKILYADVVYITSIYTPAQIAEKFPQEPKEQLFRRIKKWIVIGEPFNNGDKWTGNRPFKECDWNPNDKKWYVTSNTTITTKKIVESTKDFQQKTHIEKSSFIGSLMKEIMEEPDQEELPF